MTDVEYQMSEVLADQLARTVKPERVALASVIFQEDPIPVAGATRYRGVVTLETTDGSIIVLRVSDLVSFEIGREAK